MSERVADPHVYGIPPHLERLCDDAAIFPPGDADLVLGLLTGAQVRVCTAHLGERVRDRHGDGVRLAALGQHPRPLGEANLDLLGGLALAAGGGGDGARYLRARRDPHVIENQPFAGR